MAQPPEEILSLIGCALLHNRQQAQRDIEQALQNQRSHLTLKLAEFYFNDGTEKLLLCLSGTIVIDHRGAQYNIPIEFWLHEDHPNSAPICFVKPTRDMSIVRHCPHVEVDGKISFSYLDKWNSRTSRLAILIDDLSVAFGELPPVSSNLSPVRSNRSSACSNGSPVHSNQSPVSSNRSPNEPLPYPTSVDNGIPQPVFTTSSSSSSYISLPVVVSPAASAARELPQRTVSMNENSNDGLCHICMERSIDCVLIDCGHMVSCTKCAESFKLCPICRKNVIRFVKVFKP